MLSLSRLTNAIFTLSSWLFTRRFGKWETPQPTSFIHNTKWALHGIQMYSWDPSRREHKTQHLRLNSWHFQEVSHMDVCYYAKAEVVVDVKEDVLVNLENYFRNGVRLVLTERRFLNYILRLGKESHSIFSASTYLWIERSVVASRISALFITKIPFSWSTYPSVNFSSRINPIKSDSTSFEVNDKDSPRWAKVTLL